MSDPIEQINDAHQLEAKGLVILYEIWLRSGAKLYLKNSNNVTWQGKNYEGTAINISGITRNTDGSASRPQLQVVNPAGVFNPLIRDGELNRAQVYMIQVLKQHIEADMAIYRRWVWTITRVMSLIADKGINFELRTLTDGSNFVVPARQYIPPKFPFVSLQ
jgi:lambda family phage minor tail protein L